MAGKASTHFTPTILETDMQKRPFLKALGSTVALAASGPVMDMVLPTRMGWPCARSREGAAA